MKTSNETPELKTMAKAFSAVAFILYGVFPMHVLGWLVSAVSRHQNVENELSTEPVYQFLLLWQGGVNSMPPVLLLILFITLLLGLSYFLQKAGYSEPIDGMRHGRLFVRKLLIPAFLSAMAFATGCLSNGTIGNLLASSGLLLIFAVFAGMIYYFVDTTELDKQPHSDG